MLQKINHIRNVGRFYEVVPKGTSEASCSLENFNLVYADNATGKTTLGTIIKSLFNNDPDLILSRKTIGSEGACEISLSVDDKECNFLKGGWQKLPTSKLVFFDEEFIQKNVFSTNGVDPDQKRGLFKYVILGEENVTKAQELQLLVQIEIPEVTREITSIESQIKSALGPDIDAVLNLTPLSSEDLQKLKVDVNSIDTQIRNSEQILKNSFPEQLPTLNIPDYSTLMKGIAEIGSIENYKAHILKHRKWIEEGLVIQNGKPNCPYCFQTTDENQAVKAYQEFFSAECQELISQINTLSDKCTQELAQHKALAIERTSTFNDNCCVFWHSMDIEIPDSIPVIDGLNDKLAVLRETLLKLISQKQSNILQAAHLNDDDKNNLRSINDLSNFINSYNRSVVTIRSKIDSIKIQHQNLKALKERHIINAESLKIQEGTFQNTSIQLCIERYRNLIKTKIKLTDKLNLLRSEITKSSDEVLIKYEKTINTILKNFGVEFRIGKIERRTDATRKDNLIFAIELKGATFDPNASNKTPYSLANTLSSGDRSTLAFALFLARLQNADLNNTIVLFDDPINSLDFFRKQQTSKQISALSKKAKQVIVLTHSMEFVNLFGHVTVKSKYFKLNKSDSLAGVILTPYNKLFELCVSKHNAEHEIITSYLSAPTSVEKLAVMKSIRSYVETKLCIYMPPLITLRPPNLGTFIAHLKLNKIEQSYIDDLELINDSIVIENHGGNPKVNDYSNLTDDELRNLCKLALNLESPP